MAARIKRADRRPKGWDLDLAQVRSDLTGTEAAVLERQFPGLTARTAATGHPDDGVTTTGLTGCSHRTPRPERGATSARTGCNRRSHGVQPLHPNRPGNHPLNPPAAGLPAAEVPDAASAPVKAFSAALSADWQLTPSQRSRLAPAITQALRTGWTPEALAAITGANAAGVRSCYAVLAARLSAAELPQPPSIRVARPAWCGACDELPRSCNSPAARI